MSSNIRGNCLACLSCETLAENEVRRALRRLVATTWSLNCSWTYFAPISIPKWQHVKDLIIIHVEMQYILSGQNTHLQTDDLNRQKGKKNLWKNVAILLQILPPQFLLVLPLQMYISLVFLSLFRSRGRPIEHGTLITNSIESLNVSFPFNACIDGSSEQVVLTSTLARHDPRR